MQTSDRGLFALAIREADVLSTYLDIKKIPTIFCGHTKAAGAPIPLMGMKGTIQESLDVFRRDIRAAELAVERAVKVPLKQHEFDALVSFHHNTGAVAKASLTKALNAGDREKAGALFMNWCKPAALTARRRSERDMFLYAIYPDTTRIPVYDKWPGTPRMVATAGLLPPPAPAVPVTTVAAPVKPAAPVTPVAAPTSIARPVPKPWRLSTWFTSLFH